MARAVCEERTLALRPRLPRRTSSRSAGASCRGSSRQRPEQARVGDLDLLPAALPALTALHNSAFTLTVPSSAAAQPGNRIRLSHCSYKQLPREGDRHCRCYRSGHDTVCYLPRVARRLRDSSGQSLLEAAFITPLLLLLTFAIVDFSSMLYVHLALQNGVAQASRYGDHRTGRWHVVPGRLDQGRHAERDADADARRRGVHVPQSRRPAPRRGSPAAAGPTPSTR